MARRSGPGDYLPRPMLVILSVLLIVVLCAVVISGAALGSLFALIGVSACMGRLGHEPRSRCPNPARSALARGPPLL